MSAEIEAVVAGLKQDARSRMPGGKPRRRRRASSVDEVEQIRRFLSGAEKRRVESGEITLKQFREYEQAMLARLASMGALEDPTNGG